MGTRLAILASTSLCLLALGGPQALAAVSPDPPEASIATAPAAVLDPSFGEGGVVSLPPEVETFDSLGAATQSGDLVLSGGPNVQLLSSSGGAGELFGTAGTPHSGAGRGR